MSKLPCINHLDIYNPSYGQKKGWESNWQFDSQPLKVGNRPDSDIYKKRATWSWKALKESYKISLDLIPIEGLSKKLWMPKVPKVQLGTVSGILLGNLRKMCHSNVAPAGSYREYYMGEGGGFPQVQVVVSQVSPRLPVAYPNTKRV
jgi:hypothetical protein